MELTTYLASRGELIEQQLEKLVPEQDADYRTLLNAARYSLLGAGKRLRPILALATAEMLGSDVSAALVPGCALEMIHTYSLIHDDLPCMDNDDFRRGKPSLHKAFPEGHAVLAGDFLLTYAFDILAHHQQLTAEQRLQLIAILSRRSGSAGMIGGQVMDLEAEGKKITLDTLKAIHRYKTGAMITASVEFGAVIANASATDTALLRQFGEEIGLAFQIVDDILDVTASEQKHGKSVASDITNGKATYVSLLGLDESKNMAQQTFKSAICHLEKLPLDTTILAQIAHMIVNRVI